MLKKLNLWFLLTVMLLEKQATSTNVPEILSQTENNLCNDYPTCQLVSTQMFEKYCNRSTLRHMCPTYCLQECKMMTNLVINSSLNNKHLIQINNTKMNKMYQTFSFKSTPKPKHTLEFLTTNSLPHTKSMNERIEQTPRNIEFILFYSNLNSPINLVKIYLFKQVYWCHWSMRVFTNQ